MKFYNIFEEIKDPGHQPEDPGEEPPRGTNEEKSIHSLWKGKVYELAEWFERTRLFRLAQSAKKLDEIPEDKRTILETAVLQLAACLLVKEVEKERSPFSNLFGMLRFW